MKTEYKDAGAAFAQAFKVITVDKMSAKLERGSNGVWVVFTFDKHTIKEKA